ncbi:MAG TPA: gephyrin-like molybdotransferase Glp [Polyangia bacterium]|nr:gephyrin-like molybdotransferase Glp [Polyangia bacterium]
MLTVEQALGRILSSIAPLGAEQVFLGMAQGRALAESIVAERLLPPWDNSAMDGFAVRAAEVVAGRPLPIAFTVGAGDAPGPLAPGAVARIMTGAPVPPGADAIVKREDATEAEGKVAFSLVPAVGAHVRRAGDDVRPGAAVLGRGEVLEAGELGLIAALGRTIVSVHRRPRVAIVSTGSELVEADRLPRPGQIVGSNGWALAAQCRDAGAEPMVLPLVPDDRVAIRGALEAALAADVVLSSGGVSVGDFDFVKEVLEGLGVRQEFWKVAMKPGKPIAFGLAPRGTPVFGLPGNPASSMVAFELFVRPALRKMGGLGEGWERPRAPVVLDEAYVHDGKRRHYLRARVRRDGEVLRARRLAQQGSGMLRSMVGMNALLEIPEDAGTLAAGERVTALLFAAV